MRKIVVSDIHGCLEEFEELLVKVKYNHNEDQIISLGDIVDRGPDSMGALKKLKDLNAICILGNHEENHLRYYHHRQKQEIDSNYKIPMRNLANHKKEVQYSLTKEDFEWMKTWSRYVHFGDNWLGVHAGLEPGVPLEKQKDSTLTNIRYIDNETNKMVKLDKDFNAPPNSRYWTESHQGPYNVVYGHHVRFFDSPVVSEKFGVKTIGIDTGCVFGGSLTCFILPTEEVISVKAKKVYYEI